MNREDIIRMAQEAQMPFYWRTGEITYLDKLEAFATLVASAERERIKQANAPEIERINAHIKELEDAVKEALAQPKQEPVAFINVEQRKLEWAKYMTWGTPTVVNLPKIPLYTTPPQRKPLTDEEIRYALESEFLGSDEKRNWQDDLRVSRAIEAAHGIKGEA